MKKQAFTKADKLKIAQDHLTMSATDVGKKWGISDRTVRRFVAEVGGKGRSADDVVHEQTRERNIKLAHRVEQLSKENIKLTRIIENIVPITQEKRQLITIQKPVSSQDSEAMANTILSDVHFSEVVEPQKTNFLNEYNKAIAIDRLKKYFEGVVKLIKIERTGVKIDKLVVWMLGDMIDGYLREESMKSNDGSPVQSVVELADILYSGIHYLKDNSGCKEIEIICIPGNHGRTTAKIESSVFAENSFEWLLYMMLARDFKNTPNIKLVIPTSLQFYTQIFNLTVRALHGWEIQYNGGVGDLDIPLRKAIAGWDTAIRADLTILGHWHRLKHDMEFIVNGSVVGHNTYAISKKMKFVKPMQAFFLIDNKRGLQSTRPIFL